jgi:hypothetical protein
MTIVLNEILAFGGDGCGPLVFPAGGADAE